MNLFFWRILIIPFVLMTALVCIVIPPRRRTLLWGLTPLINNKYWSIAMREAGWDSKTIMNWYSRINRREDFDLYSEDLIPAKWIKPLLIRRALASCFAMPYVIRNAKVMHMSFDGGPWGLTPLFWLEAYLYRWARIKTVVIPYGGDAYMHSHIMDSAFKQGVLISYPDGFQRESFISRRVRYWGRHADVIMTGFLMDGMPRWDVPVTSMLSINTREWQSKTEYTSYDGKNGTVKIIHTPNHRGFKGTEFIIQAVNELKEEGLAVELVLLENVSNELVRELMPQADILAEQLIATAYALSAIEGMACGLPVLANLENETYTRVFRRYAFLNECPIVSTTPETIKYTLRILIVNPQLRRELGLAGRKYVEKYHSYKSAQYLFGSIYDKILFHKDIDLANLFHPLKSSYNSSQPIIRHPLVENQLPREYSSSSK